PDAILYRELASLSGPLVNQHFASAAQHSEAMDELTDDVQWGLDPARFDSTDGEGGTDKDRLRMTGNETITIRLPTDLVRGTTFVATARLATRLGEESAQVRASNEPPEQVAELW